MYLLLVLKQSYLYYNPCMQYTQRVLVTLLNSERLGKLTESFNKRAMFKRKNWRKPKRIAVFLLFCSRSRFSK